MIKATSETFEQKAVSPQALKRLAFDAVYVRIWVIVSIIMVGLLILISCLSLALIIPPWTPLICLALLLIPVIALSSLRAKKENKYKSSQIPPEQEKPQLVDNKTPTSNQLYQKDKPLDQTPPLSPASSSDSEDFLFEEEVKESRRID